VHVLGVGRTCSSAKRWKRSATDWKSSSRWREPGVSASDARKVGSRYVATKAAKGENHSRESPQSSSRPRTRVARSLKAIARKAAASSDSFTPLVA